MLAAGTMLKLRARRAAITSSSAGLQGTGRQLPAGAGAGAPAGEATESLRAPGCCPLSSTILAAPSTVWAARAWARLRGSPARTPPSARASIMRNTYAGPLPLRPLTALIIPSSTCAAQQPPHVTCLRPEEPGLEQLTEERYD